MSEPVLLFSGPPRSGKSTVARKIAESFNLHYISPGEILKELASDEKVGFHTYFSAIPDDVLREIVDTGLELIQEGGYVIDGRFEPLVCRQRGIFVPAIYITADFEVRAEREAGVAKVPLETARKTLMEREIAEISFCRRLFHGDYRDLDLYIGTIDTAELGPGQVYDAAIALLREKGFLRTPHE